MKKIKKEYNLLLIFALTVMVLWHSPVYSFGTSNLRHGISKNEIPTTENRRKLSPKAIFLRVPMGIDEDRSHQILKKTVSKDLQEYLQSVKLSGNREESYLSLYFSEDEHPYTIDAKGLLWLKSIAERNISEIRETGATSIYIDREAGKRAFFKEGEPLVALEADIYVKEGSYWDIPEGINLPIAILNILNNKKGALVFISGPFYIMEETASTTKFIRTLKDREIYERFGLKRVLYNGKPLTMPVLGIGGRSILLPIAYSLDAYSMHGYRVFGIEFKNAGTPQYKKHNISKDFPFTVFEEYINKPGIFLDWWHQVMYKIPVGLGEKDIDSVKREKMLLENGGDLTRLTIGTLGLFDNYGIIMRVPVGDYRRLSSYFNNGGKRDRDKFYSIIRELYPEDSLENATEKYLIRLARSYGNNLRALLITGILQGQHGSIINTDLYGFITDLDNYEKISGAKTDLLTNRYVEDWINNIIKILKIPEVKFRHISKKAFREFIKNATGMNSAEFDAIRLDKKKIAEFIIESIPQPKQKQQPQLLIVHAARSYL